MSLDMCSHGIATSVQGTAPSLVSPPAWARDIVVAEIPVLGSTARAVEELRGTQETIDARLLAEVVTGDPLMTLKVLAHASALRPSRLGSGPETVMAALVTLGITPFFAAFGPQPCAEAALCDDSEIRAGFDSVLARSRRAANFALAFAVQRMDRDALVLQQAALLHAFAELLLWLRAPKLALEIARRQAADRSLRSCVVQRAILGLDLGDLQVWLMKRWCLPELLLEIGDDHRAAASFQARTVMLAMRVARHSATGWANPAIPDDVRDVADLLHMAPEPAFALLRAVDDGDA